LQKATGQVINDTEIAKFVALAVLGTKIGKEKMETSAVCGTNPLQWMEIQL